ncbi:MAG: hypothetical protein JWP13_916 [Candidatus Saccharibacteria bacterium]|nr:hypothetical protein [Candidatus Saccharibacteria bacterium]
MNEDLNSILQKLSNYTQNYAIGQIIAELHVVVERLEFVKFKPGHKDSHEELLSQIAYLLDRDLSPGILEFVRELIEEESLEVLIGDNGRTFTGYVEAYFSEKKQVIFRTAVHMSKPVERLVQAKLMDIFPVSSRIVFEVDPSIGAGFMLVDNGNAVADYSLRTKVVKLIERRIREHVVR